MPRYKPITVEAVEKYDHIRIRRGIQWAVTIHPEEAITLANALVDYIEEQEQHE